MLLRLDFQLPPVTAVLLARELRQAQPRWQLSLRRMKLADVGFERELGNEMK
jgi:hypothetical protein